MVAVLGLDSEIAVEHPRPATEGVTDYIKLDIESLRQVVDLGKIDLILNARKEHDGLRVFCGVYEGAFEMMAYEGASIRCLELVALNLGLERTNRPKDRLEKLESRLAVLEKATAAERRLKCFVSFKFDDGHASAQVERLKRLLSSLRIECVSGEQYAPIRIEDKVKVKLRAGVDFVVAVISKGGESSWIRDELADANARGLRVIPLLENGAAFDPGIFGTLENLRYDLIDQTFLGLIEGVNFIKAELSTKVDHQT